MFVKVISHHIQRVKWIPSDIMYYWFWQNGDLIRRKIWISESVSSGVIMCQWDFGKRLVCPIQLSWLAIQRLNALPHQRRWSNFLLELFQIFIGCHPLPIKVLTIFIFLKVFWSYSECVGYCLLLKVSFESILTILRTCNLLSLIERIIWKYFDAYSESVGCCLLLKVSF